MTACSSEFFSSPGIIDHETGCGDILAHTELDYVSQDVVSSQIPDAVVLPNDDGRLQAFVPALQREDGSYIGTDTTSEIFGWSNLIAVGSAGGTLWKQAVTSTPTYITPQYATADGGMIVQSKQVQNCQSNPPQCDSVGAPTIYTLDQSSAVIDQRSDSGASPSWTGHWIGTSQFQLASFSLPSIHFAHTYWPLRDGNPSTTKVYKLPVVSSFLPSHLSGVIGQYDFPDFLTEMKTTNPPSRLVNTFFVRGGVFTKTGRIATLTHSASVDKFLGEMDTNTDAVGFVGHSLETGDTPEFSVGLMFFYPLSGPLASTLLPETFPLRQLTFDDICGLGAGADIPNCLFPLQKDASTVTNFAYKNVPEHNSPPVLLNPSPMGRLVDKIPRHARVVFLGACEIQDSFFSPPGSPFLQMWDIHNQTTDPSGNLIPATQGSAMIVPINPPPNTPDAQRATHLAVAARVWVRIVENMIGHSARVQRPMNVKDAVDEANAWAHSGVPFVVGSLNPSDTWEVIGDPTVRLR